MSVTTTTPAAPGCARVPIALAVRRLALVCVLALTVLGLSVPAAFAGKSQRIRTPGGYVSFSQFGEVLKASDGRKDGYGVEAELVWDSNGAPVADVLDGNGAGGGPNSKNLSIREGADLWLRMCYTKDTWPVKCSGWQVAEA